MTNVELVRHHAAVKAAIDRAKTITSDAELLGHWGKYVCILTAGFLENTVRLLYGAYAQRRSGPVIAAFVIRQLERVQNPKAKRLVELAEAFDKQWATELTTFLDDDGGRRKNAIDSVMNQRNLISHGRSSSISVVQVREYFAAIVEVADFIEQQCA